MSSKGIGYVAYKQSRRRRRGHEPETKPVFYQMPINLKEEEETKPVALAIYE